jgi:phage terminase large subunit
MSTAELKIPKKLVPIFSGKARYRGAYGGRGSAKTRTFALMSAVRGYELAMAGERGQIICAREYQNSLNDSSFAEIKAAIEDVPWLLDFYDIGSNYIRTKCGSIYYTFIGLRRNLDSVKSKARIHLCWIDEAETLSNMAYEKLIPTVREEGSEIWVTWNPESKESATHKRFRVNPPDDAKITEINWSDNPFFPKVLNDERKSDLEKRPEGYAHIWEGDFLTHNAGAYYAVEMRDVRENGRIGTVPYEPSVGVITSWDLGISDMMTIWFFQVVGAEVRVIDYYENEGLGLEHYVKHLKDKPYVYNEHILPHDVRVRELGSGKSRYETLHNLGLENITIAPSLSIDDGIQAVRELLPRCWFDAEKTEKGIDCLRQYHREWNDQLKTWHGKPSHDWASHGADSFRMFAVGHSETASKWGSGKALRRKVRGIA